MFLYKSTITVAPTWFRPAEPHQKKYESTISAKCPSPRDRARTGVHADCRCARNGSGRVGKFGRIRLGKNVGRRIFDRVATAVRDGLVVESSRQSVARIDELGQLRFADGPR